MLKGEDVGSLTLLLHAQICPAFCPAFHVHAKGPPSTRLDVAEFRIPRLISVE
jgi:hypothetical protein